MSILINKDTRLVVQGITGRDGSFHTGQMIKSGTNVVAGVTPGKGGKEVEGEPALVLQPPDDDRPDNEQDARHVVPEEGQRVRPELHVKMFP